MGIHTCSYYCDRPECVRAQRDELRQAIEQAEDAVVAEREACAKLVEDFDFTFQDDSAGSLEDAARAIRARGTPVHAIDISQERVDETAKGEHEPYDQQALELCEKCGWKAIIPDEGCLVCARNEHEPVMWSIFDGKYHDVFDTKYDVDKIIKFKKGKVVVKPLYTAPPKKEWVGLTDEEIWDISVDNQRKGGGFWGYPRALEAKIKEKNT